MGDVNETVEQQSVKAGLNVRERQNLRNVLVQVLTPHYTTDTAALITAAKEIEAYVLAD